jgi:phosphoribosylaminoimidazole (AIR) synthetase
LSTKTDRYATAGVDYSRVDALKRLAQRSALATAKNLPRHEVSEIEASRGESAYVIDIGGLLIASITECLGTKALIADAVRPLSGRSHYDTIAQDTIAAAVNDLISVGATPCPFTPIGPQGGASGSPTSRVWKTWFVAGGRLATNALYPGEVARRPRLRVSLRRIASIWRHPVWVW